MKRLSLIASACAALLSAAVSRQTYAGVKTWDGGAGTLSWHDPANWNPDGVPGAGDDVIVDVPSKTIVITFTTGDAFVNSLQCHEGLTLAGGSLNPIAASQIHGVFTITGGTLGGSGDVFVTSEMNWLAGTMRGTGTTMVVHGASAELDSPAIKFLHRNFENHGTVTWMFGQINFTGGVWINASDGLFVSRSPSAMIPIGGIDAFLNDGTFEKHDPITFTGIAVPIVNSAGGVFTISEGRLSTSGGMSNQGVIDVAAGTTLFVQGSGNYARGSMLIGGGTIEFNGGTHTFPIGAFTPTGVVNFKSGTFNINNDFGPAAIGPIDVATVNFNAPVALDSLTMSGGTANFSAPVALNSLTLSGGTVNFSAPVPLDSLIVSGGTLAGSGDVSVASSLIWSSGSMMSGGKMVVMNGGTLVIQAGGAKLLCRVLENHGTGLWSSGLGCNGCQFYNESDGVLNVSASSSLDNAGGGQSNLFRNDGIMTRSGAGNTSITVEFRNSGSLSINQGVLSISACIQTGGSTSLNGPLSTLTVNQLQVLGGTLQGHGQLNVPLSGGMFVSGLASISPGLSAGILTVNTGNLAMQGNLCALDIEIGGMVEGVDYDRLSVSSTASPSGRLRVSLVNTYVPKRGDAATIITAGTVFGRFDSHEMPSIGGNLYLRVVYDAVSVQVRTQRIGDTDGDGEVNIDDLVRIITQWGSCPGCDADIAPLPAGDEIVNIDDLVMVITNWG